MATQRPAFAKRDREMKLKDKARAKAEKREARRAAPRAQKGPPIEADEMTGEAGPSAQPTASATPGTASAPAGTAAPGGTAPGGTTSRRPG